MSRRKEGGVFGVLTLVVLSTFAFMPWALETTPSADADGKTMIQVGEEVVRELKGIRQELNALRSEVEKLRNKIGD